MSEIDYTEVLADLKMRRAKLDDAISAIQLITGDETEAGDVSVPNTLPATPGQAQVPSSHAFFGMSIGEAAKKYLEMVKTPTKAVDIARALKDGGLLNQSPTFAATVSTTLRRDTVLTQLPDKRWGLASWFGSKAKATPAKNGTLEVVEPNPEPSGQPSEPEQPS